jgi:uncharacterized protein YjeT (DUF2065 family)
MNRGRSHTLGLIVIGAVLYWLAVVLAMHFLEPEFNPRKVPMSAYVLGTYGGWMTTSFFALSAALLAAGYGLVTTSPRTAVTWTAFFLFIIAAMGVLLAGLFPMGFPGSPRASSAQLHALGGRLAFPTMALGPFLFSLSFRSDRHWRRIAVPSLILSSGIIILYFFRRFLPLAPGSVGYTQRIFFALLVPWMILVGLYLIRFRPEPT